MERSRRRSRPALEGLEGRTLLNGSKIHAVHAAAANTSPTATTATSNATEFDYSTAQGAKVKIKLSGAGSLAGTTLGAGGALDLVYSGTGYFTQITGTVKGGNGEAPLGSITNGAVAINTYSGVGGTLIGRINLPNFDLISGGAINLTPGVNTLSLNSVAANSQIHLRDNPLTSTLGYSTTINANSFGGANAAAGFGSNNNAGLGATTGSAAGSSTGTGTSAISTGSTAITGTGTLDPQYTGFGGSAVGAVNGKIAIIPTVGNGQNYLGTPGLTQTQVDQGRTRTFTVFTTGEDILANVAGVFTPGSNLIEPRDISLANGFRVPPPGVIVSIKHIRGGTTTNSPPLGDANIYGYDPVANTLIRFDAVTGVPLQSIALPARPAGVAVGGVALARSGAELVVLVGVGTNVFAYDASTGASAGGFTTANLATAGLGNIAGIGTAGGETVLVSTAANTSGVAQGINVASSLAAGQAVAVGAAFSPGRDFVLGGGITGVSGTGTLYALGSAYFDSFQPTQRLAGILAITPGSTKLTEASRTALTSQGAEVPATAAGGIVNDPSTALGSLDSTLALDTGVANGVNVIAKLTPSTLALTGTFTLNDPNVLADLSQSFHPELANSALIDVQGNLQTLSAHDANSLVLNDSGNLNLLQINQAFNSSVVGLPFGHVDIQNRNNVAILTNSRLVGDRGDVIVNSGTTQMGPLFLP